MTMLLVLVLSAQSALAFYNPQTGRWLSRDPIGERGGKNLYGYVDNSPINRSDILGRHEFKLAYDDQGINPAHDGKGGEAWMDWGVNTYVKKGGLFSCKCSVTGAGTSTIHWWYEDHSRTEPHELIHVHEHYEQSWNDFINEVTPYLDTPMKCKKAECYNDAIGRLARFYNRRAKYLGDVFDCSEYDNTFGACDRIKTEKPALDALAIAIGRDLLDCENQ